MIRLALAALLLCRAGVSAGADTIAVIVGDAPPHIALDRSTLADIFLKRIEVDNDGKPIVPLNLSSTNPLRIAFSLALFGKGPQGLQRYWTERYFQGISPPYTVASQEAMLRFVARTPGAIGYIASCRADARVTVVARFPVPPALASEVRGLCRRGASR
ncbi:MAG: hypothetical protein M0T84_07670 [Betaproteobacteria bacterium]|nr:hypothetical protein [Betaproteobacteria bacterium]